MYNLYTAQQRAQQQQQQQQQQRKEHFPLHREEPNGKKRHSNHSRSAIAPLPSTTGDQQSEKPHHDPELEEAVNAVLQKSKGIPSKLPPQFLNRVARNNNNNDNNKEKTSRRDSYSTFTTAMESKSDLLPIMIEIPTIDLQERQQDTMDRRRHAKNVPVVAHSVEDVYGNEYVIGENDEIFFTPDDLESLDGGRSSMVQPPCPVWGGDHGSLSSSKRTVACTLSPPNPAKRNLVRKYNSFHSSSIYSAGTSLNNNSISCTEKNGAVAVRSTLQRLPSTGPDTPTRPGLSQKTKNRYGSRGRSPLVLSSSCWTGSRLEI